MSYYAFPSTVYDIPQNLLAVLGSWWAGDYAGTNQVMGVVQGRAQLENQSMLNMLEVIAAMSRFTIPIFHTENWYPLYLMASQRNDAETSLLKYDGTENYDAGYRYDIPKDPPFNSFPKPATLADAPLILNRFIDPTMTLNNGIDFITTDDAIIFRNNPFTDPRVATRTVYKDGLPVDTQALIWVYQGKFDWELVYKQFAYVVGLRLKSSRGYKELMNAIFNAIVGGTTASDMLLAFSAMTGVPLVQEASETVVDIVADAVNLIIITDQTVYKFGLNAKPIVQVGQVVTRWQPLTDALQFSELNCGQIPNDLDALAMGEGFLSTCFYSDLIFENQDLPLNVITDDPSGYTKVTFGLGGFPLDVDHFFDELHARGVAEAEKPVDPCTDKKTIRYPGIDCDEEDVYGRRGTLAHYLDTRPVMTGEPTTAQLPKTINPLKFLIQNILRNNAYIVRVKAASAGNGAVGLYNLRLMRKITPPNTALILIVDLTTATDSITVDMISEQVETFVGMQPLADTVNQIADRRLTIRIVNGTCQ